MRQFDLHTARGRRGAMAAGAAVLLAVAGFTAVRLLGAGTGTSAAAGPARLSPSAVAELPPGGGRAGAPSSMPRPAGRPQQAVMPGSGSASRAARHGSPSARAAPSGQAAPSASASVSPSASTSVRPATSASASPTPVSGGTDPSCTNPKYTTSAQSGMWNLAPYFVFNDMWNVSRYQVSQTLYACSYSNWYVDATMNNDSGDGAVKTYPNSHRDFDSEPRIDSFKSITSTFAETSPNSGIYEDAYDIWLNGIASSGSTEVMIWNYNHGQSPAGSRVASATFGGRSYQVYKTTGNYIAFVADSNFTSGTVNLFDFFKWVIAKGWIPAGSTLGQVDYGAELVSTNGVPATFTFSNFSVNAS